jgi:hypothetical protein
MSADQTTKVKCDTHGSRTPAVVCRHMINAGNEVVGFVENNSDPDDLQAWCDQCEAFFVREGELTEAFRTFNDFAVVCDFCYANYRDRHSRMGGETSSAGNNTIT